MEKESLMEIQSLQTIEKHETSGSINNLDVEKPLHFRDYYRTDQ